MTPEELSPEEEARIRSWAKRLERVLLDTPPGIGLYTTGDRDLSVFLDPGHEIELHDGRGSHLVVVSVHSRVLIHAVPG